MSRRRKEEGLAEREEQVGFESAAAAGRRKERESGHGS